MLCCRRKRKYLECETNPALGNEELRTCSSQNVSWNSIIKVIAHPMYSTTTRLVLRVNKCEVYVCTMEGDSSQVHEELLWSYEHAGSVDWTFLEDDAHRHVVMHTINSTNREFRDVLTGNLLPVVETMVSTNAPHFTPNPSRPTWTLWDCFVHLRENNTFTIVRLWIKRHDLVFAITDKKARFGLVAQRMRGGSLKSFSGGPETFLQLQAWYYFRKYNPQRDHMIAVNSHIVALERSPSSRFLQEPISENQQVIVYRRRPFSESFYVGKFANQVLVVISPHAITWYPTPNSNAAETLGPYPITIKCHTHTINMKTAQEASKCYVDPVNWGVYFPSYDSGLIVRANMNAAYYLYQHVEDSLVA